MLHKYDNTNGGFQDKKNHLLEVLLTYFAELIPAVWAMLAVFGAMTLEKRTKPLTLVFEGPSGSGKTTVFRWPSRLEGPGSKIMFIARTNSQPNRS